ncbi:MAG TPA: helix-turn-helix transcriptional regulator [Chthonomonadaceae bacterium]|nr:helix-turn-helix transcriptional regulator [Chthonomonadaceae bacterium]
MQKTVGMLLRDARLARKLSLRGLAAAAHISPSTLSNWEAGKAQPRIPELNAVLDVLNCSESLRLEAYARIDAPRALAQLKERLDLPADDREPERAWFPSSGDLLRSLRLRQNLSLEQASALLRVQPCRMSRWEASKTRLPERYLDAYCACLAAGPEERAALKGVFLQLPQEPETSSFSRSALEQQLEQLRIDVVQGASRLMDLRFLTLETHLSKLSSQHLWAWHLLTRTYIWHAQWLQWRDRVTEAGRMAQRALCMIPRDRQPHPSWFRAVLTYSSYLVNGASAPKLAQGIRFLRDWQPASRWPQVEAWMYYNIAHYHVRIGEVREALRLVEKAREAADRTERGTVIRNSHYDSAAVLLSVGQIEKARAFLDTGEQPNIYHRITEAHVWAEMSLALGDPSGAHYWVEQIQDVIETYALPISYQQRLRQQFDLPA